MIWQTNEASDKTNNVSRTLPSLVFSVNSLTVRPRGRQMAVKGDLSVNLCKRCVFGGSFQCGPMQYYERCPPISNPVYVSNSIIYDIIIHVSISAQYSIHCCIRHISPLKSVRRIISSGSSRSGHNTARSFYLNCWLLIHIGDFELFKFFLSATVN